MATHSTLTSLLGAALLLGTTSCSQHEAAPVGTGSYQLPGGTVSCQATASLNTSSKGIDRLTIHLTTIPQPASGPETFSMVFRKLKGHPDTDYERQEGYFNGNSQLLYSPQSTITPTASGGFSGTFTLAPGSSTASSTTPTIQGGVFTEARLK